MNLPFQRKHLIVLCLSMAIPELAFASDAAEMSKIAQTTETELQGVTVTANKIEENINDVPQAITVIDSFDLEEKGIQNVKDIIHEIPNMSTTPMGGNEVGFRGLTTSTFTNNNPVVIYIDGVATTNYVGFDASMANVERVEVLRGPQGTLYGKDAIGAVINIVTREPSNSWHGKLNTELGSRNHNFASFNSSGALIKDKLFVGINGQIQQEDGWIENTYPNVQKNANAQDKRKLGAHLLYKPTDRLKAKLNIAHETNENGWGDKYAAPAGTNLSEFNRDDAEKIARDIETLEETTINSQSLSLDYEADLFNIQSTTVHKKYEMDGIYDADSGIDPHYMGLTMFNYADTDTLSQELRFSSKNSIGFRWVGGLYLDKEDHSQAPYGMEFPDFYDSTGDGKADTFYQNSRMNAESNTDSSTRAAFGQIILPIANKTELTLGGRIQRIEKEIDLNVYYHEVGASKGSPFFTYQDKQTWDTFLPKVALSHKLTDQWTTYGSFSKGYMPGGFNYFASNGGSEENSFNPQVSKNYELGIKGQFDDLTLSANLFYMDIEDTHVYKSIGTLYLTDNAEKSHSQGIELEANWFATDNLQFTGAFGYTNAEYDDYDNGYTNLKGQTVSNTPRHTIRLSAAYNSPNDWYGRVDLYNEGSVYYYNDYQKNLVKRDSFTTVDVRGGYRINDWDIYAYAKNLTDEKYITSYMSNYSKAQASFGEPRSFGLGARYHF